MELGVLHVLEDHLPLGHHDLLPNLRYPGVKIIYKDFYFLNASKIFCLINNDKFFNHAKAFEKK